VDSRNGIRTERLEIRLVVESDRPRFVDLFMDSDFMVFSATGPLDREAANARFDHMMRFSREVPFGKQAIIEISTASVIGYVGADEFEFRGEIRFEFGYRLVRASRSLGYATEASCRPPDPLDIHNCRSATVDSRPGPGGQGHSGG
jgi:RimJ/RimL family protein N-acetyltransferase